MMEVDVFRPLGTSFCHQSEESQVTMKEDGFIRLIGTVLNCE